MVHQPAPLRTHLASFVADFRRHSNQTAVVTRSGLRRQAFLYRDLAELSGRVAALLAERNIAKGDRVLLWGRNGTEWISVFWGCVLRGVLPVPIDVAGFKDFARRVAQDVSPSLVIGDQNLVEALETPASKLSFENLREALPSSPLYDSVPLAEDDPLQIIFTSGTTGEPKGVVHTHRNILASLRPIEQEMQKYLKYEKLVHPLRILHTLPLSHVFGQFMGLWIPPLLATEVHFEARLTPSDLIMQIKDERLSVLSTVPRVMEILHAHLLMRIPDLPSRLASSVNLPTWRRWWVFRDIHRLFGFKFWAFVSGGATLPLDVEQFWNALGFAVIQGYGMTETAALISLNHPFRVSRGSLGKVLPGREIQLSDQGEILVRGDTVSSASWQAGGLLKRDSDWFATGDLASVDAAGNLQFKGRKKEVIVTSSGLNIYPEDLEAVLQRQPHVKAAVVIESTGAHGPEPLAALILRHQGDAADIIQNANRELAEYQQIRRWVMWPEPDFPRTSTGKILRREVARFVQASPQAVPKTSSAGRLANLIAQITGEDPSSQNDNALLSEDLHLDSLGRVALQSAIEAQFGIEVDDLVFQQTKTFGALKSLLHQPSTGTVVMQGTAPPQVLKEQHRYPLWPWNKPARWIRSVFIELVMRPLVSFLAAPRVHSTLSSPRERILLVANHVTTYDVPLILYALPSPMRRQVAVAMAGEMLLDWRKRRGLGHRTLNLLAPIAYVLVTGLFNVFPLPQRSGFRQSFRHAGEAMDRNYHVLVFPEGRRSEGTLLPFQTGAGMLWKELGAKALPIYLEGLGELKAQRRRWFRSGAIRVRVGNLIEFPKRASPEAANRILQEAVENLARSAS